MAGGLSLPCARSVVDFVGKLSATGQPTGPTQPYILLRSVNAKRNPCIQIYYETGDH